jgi:hypothetical protein
MIYRGPTFHAVVRFGALPLGPLPAPFPPSPASNLSLLITVVFLCFAGPAYWRKRGEEVVTYLMSIVVVATLAWRNLRSNI